MDARPSGREESTDYIFSRVVIAISGREEPKGTFLSDGGERAPRMAEKACWRGVAGVKRQEGVESLAKKGRRGHEEARRRNEDAAI